MFKVYAASGAGIGKRAQVTAHRNQRRRITRSASRHRPNTTDATRGQFRPRRQRTSAAASSGDDGGGRLSWAAASPFALTVTLRLQEGGAISSHLASILLSQARADPLSERRRSRSGERLVDAQHLETGNAAIDTARRTLVLDRRHGA